MSLVGEKCYKGYELQVCKSAAGYYIGTMDEEGIPNCRLTDYAKTVEKAKELNATRCNSIEVSFCNKGNSQNCVNG